MPVTGGRGRKRANAGEERSLQRRVREEREAVYRRAINEAAERIFAEKGTDGSRMNEIAAEAGVSLGTLYGVIDGKESLLLGIHQKRMQEFMDCIRNASAAHGETLTRHLAVVRRGGQYFLDRPDFLRMCCRAGFGWASRFPAPSDAADLWEEGASVPRELFATGIAEGIYVDEDPDLMVRKMLALKQVELLHWVDHGMTTSPEEVLDRLESQFVRAFCISTRG
jgi:AcrR family transcriptional regulator